MNTKIIGPEIATIYNDPQFSYIFNDELPNPDPILKKLGYDQLIYQNIMTDPHVLGEIRPIRAGLLGFEWQIQPASDATNDIRAFELCQQVIKKMPSKNTVWSDIIWQMETAIFYGYKFHEVVWERQNNYVVPNKVTDIKNSRFFFRQDGTPRIRTLKSPIDGEALADFRFLLTRHMACSENPYGIPLLSSCYWPYIFKHSGLKFFVKFAERFSIPNAIGKYPPGTQTEDQELLLQQLTEMVESSVAVISKDDDITLLETDSTGEIHTALINLCNREISKSLTSQTLATEIQGNGSRAAAETHHERELSVMVSDREMITNTFNTFLEWITRINFSEAQPPTFRFYEEAEARLGWSEVLDNARQYMDIPSSFAHQRLQIPEPKTGEPILGKPTQESNHNYTKTSPIETDDITKIINQSTPLFDNIFDTSIEHIDNTITNSKTLHQAIDNIDSINLINNKLTQLISQSYQIGKLLGITQAQDEQTSKKKLNFAKIIEIGNVPFNEAIDFLRQKTDITPDNWNELLKDANNIGFMVSGATQASLLTDIHNALNNAIEKGLTINDFRKSFDQIVKKHGWSYKGTRNWRTTVIFDTNLHSARAAGKWMQYQRIKETVFLTYTAVRDHRTRPNHSMLHGTTRPMNDSFWEFYYPPNGWRCRCTTISFSERQMSTHNIKPTEKLPTLTQQKYQWTNPRNGNTQLIPKGIDPGFDYRPGQYANNLKTQITNNIQQMPAEIGTNLKKIIK